MCRTAARDAKFCRSGFLRATAALFSYVSPGRLTKHGSHFSPSSVPRVDRPGLFFKVLILRVVHQIPF